MNPTENCLFVKYVASDANSRETSLNSLAFD